MPEGQVLEFTHVTKRFNEVTAVSDFSARVEPGAVTAFLGPNGAGKTTTLRILLGQVRATSGTATIGGAAYAELRQPLRTIGAVLEETVYRPRRTAERQLTIAAKANGIPLARVAEVLSLVGLDGEGDSRIGGFSLGMRQRLSVAHALLGDPGALVFDEPANGLDPEGIRWMRLLMRRLADEGRTVLVSSHVLSEVEQVADNVLVLSKGQLVLASGIETLADPKGGSVIVDAADREALTAALSAAGFDIEVLRSGLTVRGGDAGTVGAVAADAGIALSTLVQRGPTLEDVFIDLMRGGGRRGGRTDEAPQQLAAPLPVSDAPVSDAPASDAPAPDADADTSAPVDSVVAIPVAAAAAWAAEAAAAPADQDVADDLAASVFTDEGGADHGDSSEAETPAEDTPTDAPLEAPAEEAPAEETPAEEAGTEEAPAEEAGETPAEEAPSDETPADDEQSGETPLEAEASDADAEAAPQDETRPEGDAQAEEPPAPSFDEILFGAAAPVAAAEPVTPAEPRHSVADIFATPDVAPDAADEAPADMAPDAVEAETSEDEAADDTTDDEEHAGVEIFADLGDDTASDGEDDAATEDVATEDDETEDAAAEDVDPRSAAVSSMLAAAARAYYEDEPKDYPLNTDDSASGDDAPDESAHWSVASTGIIDTVPVAAPDDATDDDATDDDATDEPAAESGDDENHHDGENHHG